ncbi:hypothetical protein [Streptomyces sp. NPDC057686]|uniref:hypothetical protein n=1 Tax=Streptomyces sp. NPDC057686 TaxID=3346212 RepID=UPI00369FD50C
MCTIEGWNRDDRSGEEYDKTDRGTYGLVEVPLTPRALDSLNVVSPGAAEALRSDLASAPKPTLS